MASSESPKTGLPELPKGYYWRVHNMHGLKRITLSIMHRAWGGLFRVQVVSSTLYRESEYSRRLRWSDPPDVIETAIREEAKDLEKRLKNALDMDSTARANKKQYQGGYPPNRLTKSEEDNE